MIHFSNNGTVHQKIVGKIEVNGKKVVDSIATIKKDIEVK